MKLHYGVPYWLDCVPRNRTPCYPKHNAHLDVDVAIVGGGLTGCATAYVFSAAGVRVGLFETDHLAAFNTGHSLGLLLQEPQVEFKVLVQLYGLHVARAIWKMARRSALDSAATLRRLKIRCGLTLQDDIQIAITPEEASNLRNEYKARRSAGLAASWLGATSIHREVGILATGGLRTRSNWQLNPYLAALGLADAAIQRGAVVFERSPVIKIGGTKTGVELCTERGTVAARTVIVATGSATRAFQPLRRHFKVMTTCLMMTEPLSTKIQRRLGRRRATLHDVSASPHRLQWMSNNRVMFAGADQPEVSKRRREKTLVQRTEQLMHELSLLYPVISGYKAEYGWDAAFGLTRDGLPYIGPHRNYPRHLFALGHGRNSLATAFLASRVLLRCYMDAPAKEDKLFGFGRQAISNS